MEGAHAHRSVLSLWSLPGGPHVESVCGIHVQGRPISQAGSRGLSAPPGRDPHRGSHVFPRLPGPAGAAAACPAGAAPFPGAAPSGSGRGAPALPPPPAPPSPARPVSARPVPLPSHGAPRAGLTLHRSSAAPGDGPRRGAATGPSGCPFPAGPSGARRDPPGPRPQGQRTPGTSLGLPRPGSSDTRRDPPTQPIAGADTPARSETLPRGKGPPRARGSLPGPQEPAPLGTHQLSPPGRRTPGAPHEGPGPPARIPLPGLAPVRKGSRFRGWGQPGCPGPPG